MIDYLFDDRKSIFLFAVVGGLLIAGSVFVVKKVVETEKYLSDHKCEVIDQKMRSSYEYVVQPNGKGLMLPVTKIDNLYDCKIQGDRGSRFWIKG
tara:strand:- start:129 stop:413 length:285 start_codon:yes stop_codon:yes gene_type:complete